MSFTSKAIVPPYRKMVHEREEKEKEGKRTFLNRAIVLFHDRSMSLLSSVERLLTYIQVAAEVLTRQWKSEDVSYRIARRVFMPLLFFRLLTSKLLDSIRTLRNSTPSHPSSISNLAKIHSSFSTKFFSSFSFQNALTLWPSILKDIVEMTIVVSQEAVDVLKLLGTILSNKGSLGESVLRKTKTSSLSLIRASL